MSRPDLGSSPRAPVQLGVGEGAASVAIAQARESTRRELRGRTRVPAAWQFGEMPHPRRGRTRARPHPGRPRAAARPHAQRGRRRANSELHAGLPARRWRVLAARAPWRRCRLSADCGLPAQRGTRARASGWRGPGPGRGPRPGDSAYLRSFSWSSTARRSSVGVPPSAARPRAQIRQRVVALRRPPPRARGWSSGGRASSMLPSPVLAGLRAVARPNARSRRAAIVGAIPFVPGTPAQSNLWAHLVGPGRAGAPPAPTLGLLPASDPGEPVSVYNPSLPASRYAALFSPPPTNDRGPSSRGGPERTQRSRRSQTANVIEKARRIGRKA